jgi:hypothetical protein
VQEPAPRPAPAAPAPRGADVHVPQAPEAPHPTAATGNAPQKFELSLKDHARALQESGMSKADRAAVLRGEVPASAAGDVQAAGRPVMVNGVDVRNLRRACFVAGTAVETSNGLRAIDRLVIGDQVLSRHEETGEIAYRSVVRMIVIEDKQTYRLVIADQAGVQETIRTTDEHPFWIVDHGWVRAADLREGDPLLTSSGEDRLVVSLVEEEVQETVYNIEVEEFHTYFVGESRVFVHNADCGTVEVVQNGQSPVEGLKSAKRTASAEPVGLNNSVDPFKQVEVTFDPINGDKFKALDTVTERRDYLEKYARQIRTQEDALNDLTVDQFVRARELFSAKGRNSAAKGAQKFYADNFKAEVKASIAEDLRGKRPDLDETALMDVAEERAQAIRSELAALHEPDNIAGGYTSAMPKRMGDASVNSSIGPAWTSRIAKLDEWAEAAQKAGLGDQPMNVKLKINPKRD